MTTSAPNTDTTTPEAAASTVADRFRAAWDAGDHDGLADLFTADGSMLVGDRQLCGREEIRGAVAEMFSGSARGTVLTESTVLAHPITDAAVTVIATGGVTRHGEPVADTDQVRATYVVVRREGTWSLMSHQTSPVLG